jgi:glycosyltransferase involved in cell wall biosynthesis
MNILQLFYDSLGKDPRPTRFYRLLSTLGKVTVCSAPPINNNSSIPSFIKLLRQHRSLSYDVIRGFKLLFRQFDQDIWNNQIRNLFVLLKKNNYSLIICHDLLLLPLGIEISNLPQNINNCSIIMDAREYYPRQFENNIIWKYTIGKLNDYVCRRYLHKCDVIYTVSPGLALGYNTNYSINTIMLPNLPNYEVIIPHLTSKPFRCIYHGIAIPGRKIELLIEVFSQLSAIANLDLMLIPKNTNYYTKILKLANLFPNIRCIGPVSMDQIVSYISIYDIGILMLQPNTYNHLYALPNKLFEYIQARLCLVVSPLPDIANLVRKYNVGIVTNDFSTLSMINSIKSLTYTEINTFKQNSDKASSELCWECNAKILDKDILNIIKK